MGVVAHGDQAVVSGHRLEVERHKMVGVVNLHKAQVVHTAGSVEVQAGRTERRRPHAVAEVVECCVCDMFLGDHIDRQQAEARKVRLACHRVQRQQAHRFL